MKIKIDEVLQSLNKSRFWLSQKSNVTYPTICNLCNNKTRSIQFDTLERICSTLNCGICDILEIEPELKSVLDSTPAEDINGQGKTHYSLIAAYGGETVERIDYTDEEHAQIKEAIRKIKIENKSGI